MLDKLIALEVKFNHLEMREKIILCASLFFGFYFIFSILFVDPIGNKKEDLSVDIEEKNQKIDTLSKEVETFESITRRGHNNSLNREVIELEAEIKDIKSNIEALSVSLIPADKLPQLLSSVLRSVGDLNLVDMQAQPPEKIDVDSLSEPGENVNDEDDEKDSKVTVFRHAVTLTFKGSYTNLLGFLRRLDDSEWNFYWDSLAYKVRAHPHADIELKVYTLALEKGIISG